MTACSRVTVAFDLDGTLVTEPPAPFGRIPGAVSTLRWCRRRGWRVVLWTMNSRRDALRRLARAGIPVELFDGVVAVAHKDTPTLRRRLLPLARGAKLAVVGNSWLHDVAPALGWADAVVWVRGLRRPGVMGTPVDLARYPVAVVPSVAWVPAALPGALARGYDKAAWRDYAERAFACCAGFRDLCPAWTGPMAAVI